jgi:Ca2+-transporting ATPase
MTVGVIFLGTTFSGFQRIVDTTALSLNQWLVCLLGAAPVVVASEIRKIVLRRSLSGEDMEAAADG